MATTNIRVTRDELPSILTTADDMREVALLLRENVVRRTRSGVDVHGAPFRSYSLAYAAEKQKYLGHARVDLTVSGAMLNDLQLTDVTATSATLSFPAGGGGGGAKGTFIQRSRAVASADKAEFNNETREFMGATPEEERAIVDALEKLLSERLNGK